MLIVDDHAAFRRQARALLERDGFTVIGEAIDGAAALAAVQAVRPEVVLLDIGLPDTDGFRVAERLASLGSSAIVVLTSSRGADAYRTRLDASPAAGFIAKEDVSGRAIRDLIGLA
jgi:DNA-binding NarL/FixJ family response regulator